MIASLILAALLAGEPEPQVAPRRVQWLVFGLEHCLPCRRAERDFRPWFETAPAADDGTKWEVSKTPLAHVRLIDAECESELAEKYGVTMCPCFVLVADGKEVDRPESVILVNNEVVIRPHYPGRKYLAQRYLEAVKGLK